MNIKAIIASLVLGSSSVAMAAPGVSWKPTAGDKYGSTTVRDHRVDGTREPVARPLRPIYRPAPAPIVIKPVIRPAPVAVYRPIARPAYRGGWFSGGWSGGWNGWREPVAYQQPVYQEPVYQEPAYQEPAYQEPAYQEPAYQEPVYQEPAYQRPVYQQPVTLASGLSFYGEDRKFITVGAEAGRFSKLELNAAEGQTFIKQVYVQFADGQEQVIRNLDRTLTRGQCLTLDLDGDRRAIRRIVVYGTAINNGWQGAAGAFTVTAA